MRTGRKNYNAERNIRLQKVATEKKEKGLFHWDGKCPITGFPVADMTVALMAKYSKTYRNRKKMGYL